MLVQFKKSVTGVALQNRQRGVVLVISLIVLVAMTLAALGLMRSVDTSNLVAGNLAFQQSAAHSSDQAVEWAVSLLQNCRDTPATCVFPLNANSPQNGYFSDGLKANYSPDSSASWDDFWKSNIDTLTHTYSQPLPTIPSTGDDAGNTPRYVIHRLCELVGNQSDGARCAQYPMKVKKPQNEESGTTGFAEYMLTYYRITVRTSGPRNTVSYTQVLVAL